jgi:hypothetical protein
MRYYVRTSRHTHVRLGFFGLCAYGFGQITVLVCLATVYLFIGLGWLAVNIFKIGFMGINALYNRFMQDHNGSPEEEKRDVMYPTGRYHWNGVRWIWFSN